MAPLLTILLIPLTFLAVSCAVYYAVVMWRVGVAGWTIPTARAGLSLSEPESGWPSVCVIIPAHNEADVIEHSARSLRGQTYSRLRVVYALDRCTDSTESVLRAALSNESGELDHRFTIHSIGSCPDDWAGKTNAIWSAVNNSDSAKDAELLLFTDADTEFDPDLVRAAVALLHERGVGMLSLLSTLTFEHTFEKLFQPAAGFELIRQFPLDQVNDPGDNPRQFANGQFMLFTRGAYEAVGGHESVKDELLEDIAFAVKLAPRNSGHRVGVHLADGMLTCRMYRSHDAFRTGWKRIYTEAVRRQPKRLRKFAYRQLLTGIALPAASLIAPVAGCFVLSRDFPLAVALFIAGALAIAAMIGALSMVYRAQGAPIWLIPAYPIGAWHTASILREAARDLDRGIRTEWGGRSYEREVRT